MTSLCPPHLSSARRGLVPAATLIALSLLLSGCGAITVRDAPSASARNLPAPTAAAPKAPQDTTAAGLKLARLLRDQGRFEAAAGVYAQLEQRGELKPLELLEYATVAAPVSSSQQNLALFGRVRQALQASGTKPTPAATASLCNGLGRARLALGQNDAALNDFDCTLAVLPDDVVALNGKGVLLDARNQHEQARRLLTRANQIDPADFRVLNNLALSYLASGDADQAIRLLSQAQTSQWPTLKLNLAFAQALQGDEQRARQTLSGFLSPALTQHAMADFAQRRERIRAGEPVAQELLEASRQLLPLRDKETHG